MTLSEKRDVPPRSRLRVNPCITGRRNHRFGEDGFCLFCMQPRPTYYASTNAPLRDKPKFKVAEMGSPPPAALPKSVPASTPELWFLGRGGSAASPSSFDFFLPEPRCVNEEVQKTSD